MFKPVDPSHIESQQAVEHPVYPPLMGLCHTLIGSVLAAAGSMGLLVGWGVQRLTTSAEGQGLVSILVTGIASQLGVAYQSVGMGLLTAGLPLLGVGWSLRTEHSWARPLTWSLAGLAAVSGIWLLFRMLWLPAMVPLTYAGFMGWYLTRLHP